MIKKVEQRDGNFTNNEIMCFPLGTQVRIKDSVQKHKSFNGVGALVFQPISELDDDPGERLFGILFKDAVCFNFRAAEYEIVSLEKIDVPSIKGEWFSTN